MIISDDLKIISDDIERVSQTMHKLTPFQLMLKSETFPETDENMIDFVYESSLRQGSENLFELGIKNYQGSDGREMKKDTALTYFAMAGSQGHPLGMVNAGLMFLNGEGTEINYGESFYWFSLAANYGNERGFYFLADFYMTGRGVVEENHSLAAKFYTLSAAYGSVAGLFNLGVLKFHGDGVEENYDEAFLMMRLAAEKGYEPAKKALKKE